MRKFQRFFNDIATIRAELRGEQVTFAKEVIGDSANNNRTLTVSQTIRYLNELGYTDLAVELSSVRNVLEPVIIRRRKNRRSDAVDLSEFVNTYRNVVMNSGKLRTQIGVALRNVG